MKCCRCNIELPGVEQAVYTDVDKITVTCGYCCRCNWITLRNRCYPCLSKIKVPWFGIYATIILIVLFGLWLGGII